MKKVSINPGVCGLVTTVEATADEDEGTVSLKVASGCASVRAMFEAIGTEFDPYELCLAKPGAGPLYAYAAQNFPAHGACPVIAGILKAVEVECELALARPATITFVD